MGLAHSIRTLIVEIDFYLASLDGPGIADVRDGLGRWGQGPVNPLSAQPEASCGFLEAAVAAVEARPELQRTIARSLPYLRWVTHGLYPEEEIGPRFPQSHAFSILIGEAGFVHADDYELGLFLIAPHTLYRDHHHPAPELYAPLTGPHRWRFGVDAPWIAKPAHEIVWNEPWQVHATAVGPTPFLCIFGWTRDVNLPANVVPAADWNVIEASL
jgi:hypothetical protein